jgi:PTS system beta-glucosides-specific IIC component
VENKTTVADPKAEVLSKPVDGQVVALSEVNDEVFSSGMIGEGFGIIPTSGELIAPEDGEITMLFETNHAIGLKTRNGAELLFHIGLDTVQLEGKHFTPYVKAGDQVKQGQPLIQFDLDAIKAAGFDPIVICVVTNQENFTVKPIESTDERNEQGVLSIAPIV